LGCTRRRFFYSYFDLAQEGKADPAAAEGLWHAPARVASEVRRFAPILLSSRAQDIPAIIEPAIGGTSWLMLRCHAYKSAMYIFAVSDGTGGGPVTLQPSREKTLRSVTVISETPSRAVHLNHNRMAFTDAIAPMGVAVYKVDFSTR
jgi:hypothetical protein